MDLLNELKKKRYKPDFPFPVTEYAKRIKKAQRAMAQRGIDMHLAVVHEIGFACVQQRHGLAHLAAGIGVEIAELRMGAECDLGRQTEAADIPPPNPTRRNISWRQFSRPSSTWEKPGCELICRLS